MNLDGYYINLASATERREALEKAHKEMGFEWTLERFEARQGDGRTSSLTSGELGAFLSHWSAIEKGRSDRYTLILEDDVILTNALRVFLPMVLEQVAKENDLTFLNGGLDFRDLNSVESLLNFKSELGDIRSKDFANFRILNAKPWYRHGASAYIVNPKSVEKICEKLAYANQNDEYIPIDILFARLIAEGSVTASVIFPSLTGINWEFPTQMSMERRSSKDAALYDAAANLFTAGAGFEDLKNMAYRFLHETPFDADAFIISQIIYKRLATLQG